MKKHEDNQELLISLLCFRGVFYFKGKWFYMHKLNIILMSLPRSNFFYPHLHQPEFCLHSDSAWLSTLQTDLSNVRAIFSRPPDMRAFLTLGAGAGGESYASEFLGPKLHKLHDGHDGSMGRTVYLSTNSPNKNQVYKCIM